MIDSFQLKIRVKKIKHNPLNTSDVSYFPFQQAEYLCLECRNMNSTRLLDAITLLTLGRLALTRRAEAVVRARLPMQYCMMLRVGLLIGNMGGSWTRSFVYCGSIYLHAAGNQCFSMHLVDGSIFGKNNELVEAAGDQQSARGHRKRGDISEIPA